MNLERTALVVVDVQNGFITNHSRPVVAIIADVVRTWQAAGGATVFTRFLNHPGSQFERLINWSRLEEAPETDIVDELAPLATTVVDKDYYTLFNDRGSELVKANGWTDLVFCGIATESCVLKSAVDAFELGYTPWVLSDASMSHAGPEAHEAGLLVTGRFIGRNQIIDRATWAQRFLQPA